MGQASLISRAPIMKGGLRYDETPVYVEDVFRIPRGIIAFKTKSSVGYSGLATEVGISWIGGVGTTQENIYSKTKVQKHSSGMIIPT